MTLLKLNEKNHPNWSKWSWKNNSKTGFKERKDALKLVKEKFTSPKCKEIFETIENDDCQNKNITTKYNSLLQRFTWLLINSI